MTMVVATVLPDGAVIVADGIRRSVPPGVPGERRDAQKIFCIGDALSVATLGVEWASKSALEHLRADVGMIGSPSDLAHCLAHATAMGWDEFVQAVGDHPILSHPLACTSLHAAGIAGGIPCAVHVVHSPAGPRSPLFSVESFVRQIVGAPIGYVVGEPYDAYVKSAGRALGRAPTPAEAARMFIGASAAEIRAATAISSEVGGVSRYAWIQGGGNIEEGICTPDLSAVPGDLDG